MSMCHLKQESGLLLMAISESQQSFPTLMNLNVAQWKVSGDDEGVTGESDMGDHDLAPLTDHPGYSEHDREISYDRDQKYMSKYEIVKRNLLKRVSNSLLPAISFT